MEKKPNRRWFAFRLRTLFVTVGVLGLLTLPCAVEYRRHCLEQAAILRFAISSGHAAAEFILRSDSPPLAVVMEGMGTRPMDGPGGIDMMVLRNAEFEAPPRGSEEVSVAFVREPGWFPWRRPVVGVYVDRVSHEEEDFSSLADFRSLRALKMLNVDFSACTLEAIANISSLEEIEFIACGFRWDKTWSGGATIAPLAQLPNIRVLRWSHQGVQEWDVDAIASLVGLEELEISNCAVYHSRRYPEPPDFKPLASLRNLKMLRLRHNYLANEPIVAKALSAQKSTLAKIRDALPGITVDDHDAFSLR